MASFPVFLPFAVIPLYIPFVPAHWYQTSRRKGHRARGQRLAR
jgi:hypothetical protein